MNMRKKAATASLILAVMLTVGTQSSIARESSADIGEVVFAGDSIALPLKANEVHPRVIVDFDDGEQHEFIVDTGASVNVIDSSIAESLGLEVVGETEIGAPGGPQIPSKIVIVPLARVGNVTIKNAEFVTMDVKGFSRGTTHGVLGVGLFSDYLVTFNRGAGLIKLSHDDLSANAPGVLPYDPSNGQIEIKIDVAGTTVAAHIDTGSMGEFMLPGEMMESLSLQKTQSERKAKLVGGNRDIKFAQLNGSIRFAGFQFDDPGIAFMTPSPGAGNIGSRILGDYIVSIDQKNELIEFRQE
jgi:predicted aspartyl protease